MNMHHLVPRNGQRRVAGMAAVLLLGLPWTASAHVASAAHDAAVAHPDSMSGMSLPNTHAAADGASTAAARNTKQTPDPSPAIALAGNVVDLHNTQPATMPAHGPGTTAVLKRQPAVPMGPMQGGSAPADARSGDYSDGVAGSPVDDLHLHGSTPFGMLRMDQLEAFHGSDGKGQSWEAQAWYGTDENKLWLRTEGERSGGKLADGDLEVFWNHNIATFWSTQLGGRQDLGTGPKRTWAAFGVQGLAPYWFELEATAYVGASGRTAARLRAEYELLFTQRLILQPEAEINLYGKNDPQRRIGSGISDVQFGLRLRYEIRRQFAPYIGVNWVRRVGTSADYARRDHQPVLDRQIVAGVRIWF